MLAYQKCPGRHIRKVVNDSRPNDNFRNRKIPFFVSVAVTTFFHKGGTL